MFTDRAQRLVDAAKDCLAPWGEAAQTLAGMAEYVGTRSS